MLQRLKLILATLFMFTTTLALASEHSTDSEELVKSNLASGTALLVDVRELDEWHAGHLRNAVNMPLSDLRKGTGWEKLPRDKILYLHCASGRRVLPSADILSKAGFSDVRALPWGYNELVRRGFMKER